MGDLRRASRLLQAPALASWLVPVVSFVDALDHPFVPAVMERDLEVAHRRLGKFTGGEHPPSPVPPDVQKDEVEGILATPLQHSLDVLSKRHEATKLEWGLRSGHREAAYAGPAGPGNRDSTGTTKEEAGTAGSPGFFGFGILIPNPSAPWRRLAVLQFMWIWMLPSTILPCSWM
jgi:hypothetical protein